MSSEQFSHDQAVKNLIKDYPVEALEFLAQDIIQKYGQPIAFEFLDTTVAKDDVAVPGPGQAMDVAIRYRFSQAKGVILVLVEHWSNAAKLDLLRTASYYLDLLRRFPKEDILPIALVDDDLQKELSDTVSRALLGRQHFLFHTRIVQVPALQLEHYRNSVNRVALSFSLNMAGHFNRVEQLIAVAITFRNLGDMTGFRKFFAFWIVEGKLQLDQQRVVKHRL